MVFIESILVSHSLKTRHWQLSLLLFTGQYERRKDREQTSDALWWPKPAIFLGSGLSVGYWSEDCGQWFQMRLHKCKSGQAELMNPKTWQHQIRFSKPVTDMAKKNDLLTTSFFDSLVRPS